MSEHIYSVTISQHFIQERASTLGNFILFVDEENPAILAVIVLDTHAYEFAPRSDFNHMHQLTDDLRSIRPWREDVRCALPKTHITELLRFCHAHVDFHPLEHLLRMTFVLMDKTFIPKLKRF